jgi:hypothetical protein
MAHLSFSQVDFPGAGDLLIEVLDWNAENANLSIRGTNQIIGSAVIDLDNRCYSKEMMYLDELVPLERLPLLEKSSGM